MAVRQYIGARYVPKFVGLWNNTTQYNALEVVDNGAGTTYIARKTVPAGTALTNTDFWFIYGASSGAIIDLQTRMGAAENDIDDIETDITNIENKIGVLNSGVIIIGDSYAVDASAGGKSWASYVSDVYPDVYKGIEGGTGFGSDVYITDNFLTLLQALSISDPKDITQIVVIGGANDGNLIANGSLNENTLRARIDSFCDYAKTTYPNAKVKIAFVGGYRNSQRISVYNTTAKIYRSQVSKHSNAAYFANGEPIMHNNGFINSSDLVHPTADASEILGEFALSIIGNGDFTFLYNQNVTYTPADNVQALSYITSFVSHFCGNNAEITFTGSNSGNTFISVIFNTDFSLNEGGAVDLMVLDGVPVGGVTPSMSLTSCIIGATGQAAQSNIPIVLGIQGSKLFAKNVSGQSLTVKNILIPLTTLRVLLDLN